MQSDVFGETGADIFTFHAAHELLPSALDQAIVRGLHGCRPSVSGATIPVAGATCCRNMPRYFRSLDLDSYDLVVYSSHACAVQARARVDALTVCYCDTPMRYAWMPDTDAHRAPGIGGWALARFGSHRSSSAWKTVFQYTPVA